MFGRAGLAPATGFDLRVDLASDLFSRRWWRGAATLALLCTAAGLLAPGVQPLAVASVAHPAGDGERLQQQALAIAPLSSGSATGLRMAASDHVVGLDYVPGRPWIALDLRAAEGEHLGAVLARAGAAQGDAANAEALVRSAVPGGIAGGTAISLRLGERNSAGTRPIERLEMRAGLGVELTISRGDDGLKLTRRELAVDTSPIRIRGKVGDGLYWSLRAAGASPATAAEYLQALAQEIDVGEIGPDSRFDLVLAHRRTGSDSSAGPLLYAGLERIGERRLQLVRWGSGGQERWIEASSLTEARTSEAVWPVAGRVTSGFGYRVHPIFRFARFHSGVDFAAPWGTPIVATGDGQVIAAGWNGGYGRQVRIAHGDGMVTTYSHMSQIAAAPGGYVRSGQVIGYVGSSGLSTGPHLHYEVYQHGRAVNPLGIRFASRPMFSDKQRSAFEARLNALLKVGEKRG